MFIQRSSQVFWEIAATWSSPTFQLKRSAPDSKFPGKSSWINYPVIFGLYLLPYTLMVWIHVATWVKDTISSPQMSTLIFLRSPCHTLFLSHFLLPHCPSLCCEEGGAAGQSDQNGSYLGLGHQCWRDVCMWLGVESRHADTLQTLWNEVRWLTPWCQDTHGSGSIYDDQVNYIAGNVEVTRPDRC